MAELNHLFTTNNDRYLATDRIMLVATRSRNSSSNGRRNTTNVRTIDVTNRSKSNRSAILLLIGRVLYIRLQKSIKKRGVIRQTFNEYHERYDWLTERQVRYALERYTKDMKVSSVDEPVLEPSHPVPERITYDETTNFSVTRKVCKIDKDF